MPIYVHNALSRGQSGKRRIMTSADRSRRALRFSNRRLLPMRAEAVRARGGVGDGTLGVARVRFDAAGSY
eukprot:2769344-Pleurochrysis_carterae.AAC.1